MCTRRLYSSLTVNFIVVVIILVDHNTTVLDLEEAPIGIMAVFRSR